MKYLVLNILCGIKYSTMVNRILFGYCSFSKNVYQLYDELLPFSSNIKIISGILGQPIHQKSHCLHFERSNDGVNHKPYFIVINLYYPKGDMLPNYYLTLNVLRSLSRNGFNSSINARM